MLKVNIVYFEDLTENEKMVQPNNGHGKEYANYIKITDESETVMILSDAVEPEDAKFTRDFRQVIDAIEKAYKIGLDHGKRLMKINALNSLEIIDWSCMYGECEYILAEHTEENRNKLLKAGFTEQEIDESLDSDKTTIDLSFLAFNCAGANWWTKEKGFERS